MLNASTLSTTLQITGFDFHLDHCPGVCVLVEDALRDRLAKSLPQINSALAAAPLLFSVPSPLVIASPRLQRGDRFFDLSLQLSLQPPQKPASMAAYVKGVLGTPAAATIACPDIPKARFSKCL